MNQLRIEHVAGAARHFIDVTDVSREAGFSCAVAVSPAVYTAYVALPRLGPVLSFTDAQRTLRERLWNVLSACRDAINAQRSAGLTQLDFKLYTRVAGPYALSSRYHNICLRVSTNPDGSGLLIERIEAKKHGSTKAKKAAAPVAPPEAIRLLPLPAHVGYPPFFQAGSESAAA